MFRAQRQSGFTIVELLIVIVVIGILAAITIVAFNGIRQQAVVSSLKTDLAGYGKKIEIIKSNMNNSTYPSDLSGVDIVERNGVVRDYRSTGSSYCLSLTQGGIVYRISDGKTPEEGPCPLYGIATTLAGSGVVGYADGLGTAAQLSQTFGIAIDQEGVLYASSGGTRIRKITPAGQVTTLTLTPAVSVVAIHVHTDGYIYATGGNLNHRVFKISPTGAVTTIGGTGAAGYLDGDAAVSQFNSPYGITVAADGTIYVADSTNHRIRKITQEGVASTIAGQVPGGGPIDATGAAARFNRPYGITMGNDGNIYTSDTTNQLIRKVTPEGVVTTHGNARFGGFDMAPNGDIYGAQAWTHQIVRLSPSNVSTIIAGSGTAAFADGVGTSAAFNGPNDVVLGKDGTIYVADLTNNRIRVVK